MFNTQKIHIFFSWFVIHYHEMIPLIPLVHFKHAPDKTYQMSPILYVSSRRIVWGAQTLWNLNKIFAKFRSKPAIRDLPRLEYLEQSVFRTGNKDIAISARIESEAAAPETFPNFQVLNPLLNDDALIDAPGEKYFTATYRIQPHRVQGIEATIDVFNIPGMKPGSYCVKSITRNLLGAFKLDFSWQLHFPKRAKV